MSHQVCCDCCGRQARIVNGISAPAGWGLLRLMESPNAIGSWSPPSELCERCLPDVIAFITKLSEAKKS